METSTPIESPAPEMADMADTPVQGGKPGLLHGAVRLGLVLAAGYLAFLCLWRPGALLFRNLLVPFIPLMFAYRPRLLADLARDAGFWLSAGYFLACLLSLWPMNAGFLTLRIAANWVGTYVAFFLFARLVTPWRSAYLLIPPLATGGFFLLTHALAWAGLADASLFYDQYDRLTFAFEAPTRLGLLYGICFCLCAGVCKISRFWPVKILAGALLPCFAVLLFLTGTRGAMVASALAFALAFMRGMRPRNMAMVAGFGLVVVLALFAIKQFGGSSNLFDRLSSMTNPFANGEIFKTSLPSRMGIWTISAQAVKQRPVTGIGFGRFEDFYREEAKNHADMITGAPEGVFIPWVTTNAHNFELHLLVETGVVGFSVMFALWVLVIFRGFRHRRALPVGLAFFCALVTMQLNHNLTVWIIGALIFALAGLSGGLASMGDEETPTPTEDTEPLFDHDMQNRKILE